MTDNKKALLVEESKLNNTFIIPQNVLADEVLNNMPDILKDIMVLFQKKHINISFNCLLNILIAKTAQMITAKRVTLKEVEKINRPNWYAILLVNSGMGKDLVTDDLDNCIFKNFRLWFDDKANKYQQEEINKLESEAQELFCGDKLDTKRLLFVKEAAKEIRPAIIEMSGGTQEGFYADAKVFSCSNFGSIFLKISELGLYLNTMNNDNLQFFTCLYDAYDGKVASKCTKHSKREQDIKDLPVNTLLYSDYTLFKSDIKGIFNNLMNMGFNRRAVLTFQPSKDLIDDTKTFEEMQVFYNQASNLNDNLFSIFQNINSNACYILQQSTKDNILNEYKSNLIREHNNCDDEFLKREIKSRELKALKLSCLYACLNHPAELIINDDDMKQAITTVQALSKDLKAFIDFKPVKKDEYEKFYSYLKENIGVKYSTIEFKQAYKQTTGLGRDKINAKFTEIITNLKELAEEDNHILLEEPNEKKNGLNYTLCSLNNPLSDNVLPFEKMIFKK